MISPVINATASREADGRQGYKRDEAAREDARNHDGPLAVEESSTWQGRKLSTVRLKSLFYFLPFFLPLNRESLSPEAAAEAASSTWVSSTSGWGVVSNCKQNPRGHIEIVNKHKSICLRQRWCSGLGPFCCGVWCWPSTRHPRSSSWCWDPTCRWTRCKRGRRCGSGERRSRSAAPCRRRTRACRTTGTGRPRGWSRCSSPRAPAWLKMNEHYFPFQ